MKRNLKFTTVTLVNRHQKELKLKQLIKKSENRRLVLFI